MNAYFQVLTEYIQLGFNLLFKEYFKVIIVLEHNSIIIIFLSVKAEMPG